jgi:DNA-binding NarL/FixJ family response regulator
MGEGDGESRYVRLEAENERLREDRDEMERAAWVVVGAARELGRTLATHRKEPFEDSDLIPDRVRQLEVEVQRLRRELRKEYPRARRAEDAEHQRDEYLAVLRLVADGEEAREIARALIAKWAAPRRRR